MAFSENKTNTPLNEWITTVDANLPNLSKSQATVLALFSFGMVVAKCCALTTVVIILAPLLRGRLPMLTSDSTALKVKENTLRQRLREWYYNAEDKRGHKRVALDVESCFPFLLRWILSLWDSNQLALAMDATTLSNRFVVLAIKYIEVALSQSPGLCF